MAVSSTTSGTSANSGAASIDVAGIVEGLMTIQNRPLDAIKAKISDKQLVISELGTIKSKVSALGDALTIFQNPNSYNSAVASTTDATVLQASAAIGARVGSYTVNVDATALASKYTIEGYSSSSDLASINSGTGFSITVGSTTYSTLGTPAGTPTLSATSTIADLKNWINSLGVNVNASLVQTTDSSHFALMIQSTLTGLENAVSYAGISIPNGPTILTTPGDGSTTESAAVTFHAMTAGQTLTMAGLTFTAGASGATAIQVASAFASIAAAAKAADINVAKSLDSTKGGTFSAGAMASWSTSAATGADIVFTSTTAHANVQNLTASGTAGGLLASTVSEARDASFSLNGTDFKRPTNSVSDVIDGVTLNLVKSSGLDQTVNITRAPGSSQKVITDVIAAYNDLIKTYQTMTANSNNSTTSKVGTFANSPTTLSFVNDIKNMFALGATYGAADPVTGKKQTLSMSAMGMDLQLDGTIKFNAASYSLAASKGLDDILAAGVHVGGKNGVLSTGPSITTTQGSALRTETANVLFNAMTAGQTLTVAGLTFKAGSQGATAGQLASAFSNIGILGTTASSINATKLLGDAAGGTFISGVLADWTSAPAVGSTVTFTSGTANTDVTDLIATQTVGATDLSAFISSQIGTNGAITSQIKNETTATTNLTKRQADLTDRLNTIQTSLVAQYSALNALLYQLSSTSTALSSALTALTNSQSSKN